MEWIEHDFVSGASFGQEKCRISRPRTKCGVGLQKTNTVREERLNPALPLL
jgi:hypothetical protein